MSDACAYRSEHPDVLACYDRIHNNTWFQDVVEWGRDLGFTGKIVTIDGRLAGFTCDGATEVHEDWQTVNRSFGSYFAPRRRTKAQKALCAEIAALGKEPSTEDFPGMPTTVSVHVGGTSYRRTAPEAISDGTTVWLKWDAPAQLVEKPDPVSTMFATGEYDPNIWKPAKVSEYYAVFEDSLKGVEL